MKRMRKGIALAVLLFAAGSVSAASNEVLVLFNGQTEVNRETYKFLARNVGELNLGVTLKASQDPSSVKVGVYKAVLVLSTGLTSGVDPVLKRFIDQYPAKAELFLVNLTAGSTSLTVQKFASASAPQAVDTVTAASVWSEGPDKMTYINLHKEWINVFAAFLRGR